MRREAGTHFRAVHRDQEATLVIRIELRRGWDCIRIPDQELPSKKGLKGLQPYLGVRGMGTKGTKGAKHRDRGFTDPQTGKEL